MKLSVVIPAYNEEENIEQAVSYACERLSPFEVIVINDCSTDGTLRVLKSLKKKYAVLRVYTNKVNSGHGATVMRALHKARGSHILYMDADNQLSAHPLFFNFTQYVDSVVGWRYCRQDKPFRLVVTRILRLVNLLRHGVYIKDANCPMKLYKRESLKKVLPYVPTTHYIPIACIEVLMRKRGMKVLEIPITHEAYAGERQGFLQGITFKTVKFFILSFIETMRL